MEVPITGDLLIKKDKRPEGLLQAFLRLCTGNSFYSKTSAQCIIHMYEHKDQKFKLHNM